MIGPAISGWSPARLGVHQAVEVSGGVGPNDLPSYVIRPHDHEVRRALRGKNPFVVLTGTSCTGKTRTAFEAVRAELADLPLFRPFSTNDLVRHMPDHPAVVWLNEIHRFLVEDAAVAALDAALRVRGLVVIGTTLTEWWSDLTRDNSAHPAARELLVAAHRVEVSESFSGEAMGRLRDAGRHDPRLAFAAEAAESDGKVIQALAGGPELVRAYHDPANAIASAVIKAAIQASVLIDSRPVPVSVVHRAAPAYLREHERAVGQTWFMVAETQATAPVHGIRALTKTREQPDMGQADHYHVHEYLLQHFRSLPRETVPAVLWEALLTDLVSAGERVALARSAVNRGLLRLAVRAVHPVADNLEAVELMVREIVRYDHPNFVAWARVAAGLGSARGMWDLAMQKNPESVVWWQRLVEQTDGRDMSDYLPALQERGLLEHALQWLGPARENGSTDALIATLRVLRSLRRYDEAVDLALPLADDPERYSWLSGLHEDAGATKKAVAVLTKWAEAGDTTAMLKLTELLQEHAPDESRTWLELAASLGSKWGIRTLADPVESSEPLRAAELWKKRNRAKAARLFAEGDDIEAAVALWQEEADLGHGYALRNIAELRMDNGQPEEAERWYRAAARSGEAIDRDALASFLAATARLPEALELWNAPMLLANPVYLRHRFDALTSSGRTGEALAHATALAEAGSLAAMRLLAGRTDDPDAAAWRYRAARAGASDIARDLARAYLAEGKPDSATELLLGTASRNTRTEALLREALIARGEGDEAERMLRTSIERGDDQLYQLVRHLQALHREAEADQADMYGIEIGGATAAPWTFLPPES